jgi:hypothetical protein
MPYDLLAQMPRVWASITQETLREVETPDGLRSDQALGRFAAHLALVDRPTGSGPPSLPEA